MRLSCFGFMSKVSIDIMMIFIKVYLLFCWFCGGVLLVMGFFLSEVFWVVIGSLGVLEGVGFLILFFLFFILFGVGVVVCIFFLCLIILGLGFFFFVGEIVIGVGLLKVLKGDIKEKLGIVDLGFGCLFCFWGWVGLGVWVVLDFMIGGDVIVGFWVGVMLGWGGLLWLIIGFLIFLYRY